MYQQVPPTATTIFCSHKLQGKHIVTKTKMGPKEFKKGLNLDQRRRRRDTLQLQVRKIKREEGLQKRRSEQSTEAITPKENFIKDDIPNLVAKLLKIDSSDESIEEAIFGIKQILSDGNNPPVQDVIDSKVLRCIVNLLERNDNNKIQIGALLVLNNIASTTYTESMMTCGSAAIPALVKLLYSNNVGCRVQSACCLGNFAGDSIKLRDSIIHNDAVAPLLQNIANPSLNSLLRNATWALSKICSAKPHPALKLEHVRKAIELLAVIVQQENSEALVDACWTLSYLSDGDDNRIQSVMDGGVTPYLVNLLCHKNIKVITPTLRILGNFTSGNEDQTQQVIDAGILEFTPKLLVNKKKDIRKQTCWLLSNIAAGSRTQIGSLMRKPINLCTVIENLRNSEWEVRKEAAWVISNITSGGSDRHIQGVVELGAIDAICSVLTVRDAEIIMVALESIDNILEVGEKLGKGYTDFVDECDGVEKIELLQQHVNDNIYNKVVKIIETYFGVEDEYGDENILPERHGNQFSFGVSPKKLKFKDSNKSQKSPLQQSNF